MYSDELLASKRARIKENLEYIVQRDIPGHVDPAHQAGATRARPVIDLRGWDFLDFTHNGRDVPVPMDALQFLDDLSTVRAWIDWKGCNSSTLQSYLVHHATPNGKTMDPISAFGLDRSAVLKTQFVDDVSTKYYKSAVWFLLAHEMGHVALGHTGRPTLSQENEADAFAIEAMRRKRLNPAGIVLYMTAITLFDREAANRTHASNGERVELIAQALRQSPEDFLVQEDTKRREHAAIILSMADELSRLATALKRVRKSEEIIEKNGGKVDEIYRNEVFKAVDYKSVCRTKP